MNIDPDLALTVAAVIEEGTLDAAAQRLHLTPSAVSQRVKQLEERLGQRLLVRTKPVRATAAGAAVAQFAQQVAAVEHEATAALGLTGTNQRLQLPIAVNSDSLASWLMPPLARFASDHEIDLDLRREDQERTADLLEDGTVLAAVTSRGSAVAGCRVARLGSMPFEAVAAPSWRDRWAPARLGPAELAVAPRVDFDRHDVLQRQWLAHHHVDARHSPRHLVPSTHDIAHAVVLGLGWAMVPRDQAESLIDAGQLVPLGGPSISTALFWQYWKGPSGVLEDLTSTVTEHARRYLER